MRNCRSKWSICAFPDIPTSFDHEMMCIRFYVHVFRERIQLNLKRQAKKHTVRAKHLQKWNVSLQEKESSLQQQMQEIQRRDIDVQQQQTSLRAKYVFIEYV